MLRARESRLMSQSASRYGLFTSLQTSHMLEWGNCVVLDLNVRVIGVYDNKTECTSGTTLLVSILSVTLARIWILSRS